MKIIKEFFLLNIIFPAADLVMGTCAIKWYKKIKCMNKWSPLQIKTWQEHELQKFIKHAYNNTIYYKRIFDELELKPEDIQTAEDLKKLPIITKEIVKEHFDEIVPKNLSQFKYREGKTGGTTGVPMFYYCDENTWGYVTAAKIYAWKTLNYHYGEKFVTLGSSSLFPFDKKVPIHKKIYNKLREGIMLNGVNLTDDICQNYIDIILENKVKYIYGYAASIYILTKYIEKNNLDLTQVKAVFTTAEMLTPEYRELMERIYKCRVMDCYGARDAGITAYEIEPQQYHVGYNIIAELINPFEENTGTLLTTNFLNYSFPLIRYQFGDEVKLEYNSHLYNGQLITKVIGRTNDIMRLDNGHNLTATGFSMIMKEFDILAFEIKKTGGLEVELKIQPDKAHYNKEQEDKIMQSIQKYVGSESKVNLVYVDEFLPLENGKRKYFLN